MLRAAYFASKLGFEIDNETLLGMKSCSYLVQNLSCDRICWELEKLINSTFPKIGVNYLIETNIAPYLSNFKKGIYLFKEKNLDMIQKRLRTLISGLANCGLDSAQTSNDDLRTILDNFLNGGMKTEFGTVVSE